MRQCYAQIEACTVSSGRLSEAVNKTNSEDILN